MRARSPWESGVGSLLSIVVICKLQEFHSAEKYSATEKEVIKERLIKLDVHVETIVGEKEEMLLQTHYNVVREL